MVGSQERADCGVPGVGAGSAAPGFGAARTDEEGGPAMGKGACPASGE